MDIIYTLSKFIIVGERKFTYNPHLKMNVEKESSDKFTMNLEEIEPG